MSMRPEEDAHRRPDDWRVLAARGAAASLIPTAPQQITPPRPVGCDPSTVWQRQRVTALYRVAAELRGMLADAPKDDPDVADLLRDCATLEEVAGMLSRPVTIGTVTQP